MDSPSTCCQNQRCSQKSRIFGNQSHNVNLIVFRVSNDFLGGQQMTLKFADDKGLSVNASDYPLTSTPHQGLEITLGTNTKINVLDFCTSPSFLIHSPFELPGSYDLNEMIEFSYHYDLEVLITPEVIKTDADLRSHEPEKRGCYFEGEKKLKYFKVYTKRNCEFECLAENLYNSPKLNCTPYYMVRSDSVDRCDYRHGMLSGLETFRILRNISKSAKKCVCLEECDSIKYKIEVVAHTLLKKNHRIDERLAYSESSIQFKFKDVDVVPMRRQLSMTFSDFLAQSGGMLGLFAGISALSIIELFYFMSLRWIVNLWRWIMTK
jgi:acid-sensing ion channel, other